MLDKPAKPSRPSRDETTLMETGFKRPLIPIVLSLMLGLGAAAWGFEITGIWLIAGLAGLLAVMFLVYYLGFLRASQDTSHNGNDGSTDLGQGNKDSH